MHEMTIRVYYEDTDFGGVVYYANYLKFIERGRTEALREMGVDQVALKAEGRVFVVRRANIDWLAPARFDDLLVVYWASYNLIFLLRCHTRFGAGAEVDFQTVLREGNVFAEHWACLPWIDDFFDGQSFRGAKRR